MIDKQLAFLMAAQTGLIVQAVQQDRAPSFAIATFTEALGIPVEAIPDDIESAALDFVEYTTQTPQMAPDRFHELPPIDRPQWMPDPNSFVEVLTATEDDADSADDADDDAAQEFTEEDGEEVLFVDPDEEDDDA